MGLFGIGDGKMEMQLSKNEFVSGEKIEGTATLTLNKDIKAKGVVAEIWGERTETTRNMNGQIQRRQVVVYKFASNLDVERAYMRSESPKTYKFTLDAPDTGGMPSAGSEGTAARVFSALGQMAGGGAGPIMWFVGVKVVMPALEFSIAKKQQISIVGNRPDVGMMQ